jgi:ATP-binding cassette subfamily B protein
MQFPNSKQVGLNDCGPACVKIISEYYGIDTQLKELIKMCDVGKHGISIFNLDNALKLLGFNTLSVKVSWADFLKIQLPCIVYWNQRHFVVPYLVANCKVHVSDPGKGLVAYSNEDFQVYWKGFSEKGIVQLAYPKRQMKANRNIVPPTL